MKTNGLNRAQLKYLAIIAMVIDHTAWGFVDFMSPLGQIMHIFGRLTLPIMCYFVAEGFRHTSDLRKYIGRMMTFAVLSVLPFYIFFHEEYEFRQNIIFDLLLALLALTVMEHKKWAKWVRILCVAVLLTISAVIGGWIIMPIVYVLIFYYSDSFKQAARRFCLCTILMELLLVLAIVLNQIYHFSHYNWTVAERLYLLGFMWALIPLSQYNGEKGVEKTGRYFFYLFYPAHFLALEGIKLAISGVSAQQLYILTHVIALFVAMGMLLYVVHQKNSRAQMATTFFLMASVMYVFGFLLEITTSEVAGVYTATKLQYFAECFVFIGVTFVIQELCRRRVPVFIFAGEIVVSIIVMYCMFTYEKNGYMYKGITINTTDGAFPHMEITEYGFVFYLFVAYTICICMGSIILGYRSARENRLQKRRLDLLLCAMLVMWIPYLVKVLNLTNGYEVPALGVAVAATFVAISLGKYGFLDSVQVNHDYALMHGNEGVMSVDNHHYVMYHNELMHKILGDFGDFENVDKLPLAKAVLEGSVSTVDQDGHTYEFRLEPVVENGVLLGQNVWAIDVTEHIRRLNHMTEIASIDPLTQVYNRRAFEETVGTYLQEQGSGALYVIDLDNFKNVNDSYGHLVGDDILNMVGKSLRGVKQGIVGRIGGDEFCLFVENQLDKDVLAQIAEEMIRNFAEAQSESKYGKITAITLGIAILDQHMGLDEEVDYAHLFKRADRALYMAKQEGKNTYRFYTK